MSTIAAGTYGWLNRDGTLHNPPTFTATAPFVGHPECFVSIVVDTQPIINPATQTLVQGNAYVSGGVVHFPWTIVALSQDQQNDVADKSALTLKAQAAYTALTAHTATGAQTQDILAVVLRYVARQEGITLT